MGIIRSIPEADNRSNLFHEFAVDVVLPTTSKQFLKVLLV